MQRRKLFIALAAILTISLMGLSATCLASGEAPILELEIYDGPDYSESNDMCYYKVEAIVTVMPEPEIEFDVDDNIDLIGNGRVEVFVDKGESYTLTATATSLHSTTSVSIPLRGECVEEVAAKEEVVEEEIGRLIIM